MPLLPWQQLLVFVKINELIWHLLTAGSLWQSELRTPHVGTERRVYPKERHFAVSELDRLSWPLKNVKVVWSRGNGERLGIEIQALVTRWEWPGQSVETNQSAAAVRCNDHATNIARLAGSIDSSAGCRVEIAATVALRWRKTGIVQMQKAIH